MDAVIHRFGEISSTQSEARRLIDAGDADAGHIIVADRQTKGRGRFGRTWLSPQGGLYATFIVTARPGLSLVSGVAVIRALARFGVHAGLKWPNDVMLNEAKLAGILIETAGELALVGIGINLTAAPLETATSVQTAGTTARRGELIVAIREEMTQVETTNDLRTAYREHLRTLGKEVRIVPENEGPAIFGTAVDIDTDGQLLVETERGSRTISTGECLHLRVEPERNDDGMSP